MPLITTIGVVDIESCDETKKGNTMSTKSDKSLTHELN